MAKKKRVYRKAKPKPPKGYDSVFEYDLHKDKLKDWEFHPDDIHYHVPHKYEPDFKLTKEAETVIIEVKGRFRERQEASKYIYIREVLKDSEELVFIFYKASTPMPHAKRRKNGTKQTHAEWAEKNNFRYYCMKEGFDTDELFR